MKKRLKEKDLLYQGERLADRREANDILDDFLTKNDLSVCPFKSKKELTVNNALRSTASLEVACTPVCCGIVGLSTLAGGCAMCMSGDPAVGCGACIITLAALGLPYTTTADDAFVLSEGLKLKLK